MSSAEICAYHQSNIEYGLSTFHVLLRNPLRRVLIVHCPASAGPLCPAHFDQRGIAIKTPLHGGWTASLVDLEPKKDPTYKEQKLLKLRACIVTNLVEITVKEGTSGHGYNVVLLTYAGVYSQMAKKLAN